MDKTEKLDKDRILQLLAEADTKWFTNREPGSYKYQEHLEFQAYYIVRNYHKETKHGNDTLKRKQG